jgi:predicted Rossmann fold nucleotide-binding protein DprA/Smf involved in DNA uptake
VAGNWVPTVYGRGMGTLLYRVGAPLRDVLRPCPVAVAGTRDPTPVGTRLARELGRRLAEGGYSVITGFARGVDESAAFGALEAGGRVVAVLPYLFEADGRLSLRATQLLRVAAEYGALASVVAENLAEDGSRVRMWLATRNRIIVRFAAVLIVPEARYKPAHWGTRHAVERALAAGRPVVVLEPRVKHSDVVRAFEHFKRLGALVAKDIDEVLGMVEHCFSRPAGRLKNTPQ